MCLPKNTTIVMIELLVSLYITAANVTLVKENHVSNDSTESVSLLPPSFKFGVFKFSFIVD